MSHIIYNSGNDHNQHQKNPGNNRTFLLFGHFRLFFPRCLTKEEIDTAYEKNTGLLIVDYFKDKDYEAVPAVLCKNHGPFTWGKDGHEAVHNAVVLEEVAKMAARCEMINPQVKPAPQELQDKHYYRKHGANAYYGQK